MHKLSTETALLLSSGQVVTNISNCVKELLENSLDAEASFVEVKLEKSGLSKIEVRDNGSGINSTDISCAAQRHFTSKIHCHEDLQVLSSYGFRGEALSSMCEVADVSITTRTKDELYSTVYWFDNKGVIKSKKPSHIAQGTTVTVCNLFKNLPVRKQFFSSTKKLKEQVKLTQIVVMSLALAHPSIQFKLFNDKGLVWQKPKSTSYKSAFGHILSIPTQFTVKQVHCSDDEISIKLFLPKQIIKKKTNEYFFLIVNNRPIQCKPIEKLFCAHFTDHTQQVGGWPVLLLVIDVKPSEVDVNVNANKTEVFFTRKEEILSLLKDLLQADEIGNSQVLSENNFLQPACKDNNGADFENHDQTKYDQNKCSSIDSTEYNSMQCPSKVIPEFSCKLSVMKNRTNTTSPNNAETSIIANCSPDSSNCGNEICDLLSVSNTNDTSAKIQKNILYDQYPPDRALIDDSTVLNSLGTEVAPNIVVAPIGHNAVGDKNWSRGECFQDSNGESIAPVVLFSNRKSASKDLQVKSASKVCKSASTSFAIGKKRSSNVLSLNQSTLDNIIKPSQAKKPCSIFEICDNAGDEWEKSSQQYKRSVVETASKEYDDFSKQKNKISHVKHLKPKRKSFNVIGLSENEDFESPAEFPLVFCSNKLVKDISLLNDSDKALMSSSRVNQKLIGNLSKYNVVVLNHNSMYFFVNLQRLQENAIFQTLSNQYKLPCIELDFPIELNNSNIGPKGLKCLQKLKFSSGSDLAPDIEVIDERIIFNGFKIRGGNNMDQTLQLYSMTTNIPYYGLEDLKEILNKIDTSADVVKVKESRPVKVLYYLQGEAARVVKTNPPLCDKCEILEAVKSLKKNDMSWSQVFSSSMCFHRRKVFHPLDKMTAIV